LPPDRVQQCVAKDALFADQIRRNFSVGQFLDAFHLFRHAQRGTLVAHVIGQRLDHFRVREFQQARTLFHNDDAHAERRKHARVLHSDDPAS
jgi:hypothetical protein